VSVTPRIAASTYLNSAPLVHAFAEGSQRDACLLLPDPAPAMCAQMLGEGLVDAALIPSIELQRIPGLAVPRNVCIAARNAVRSVLLVASRALADVRTVALDEQSRTSATLVRILMRRAIGNQPAYTPAAPDLPRMLASNDAALIIGDPAMTADLSGLQVYDMAALWRDFTGLPFVFATWAVHPDRLVGARVDFEAARDEGLRAIPQIARRYAPVLNRPVEDLEHYLSSSIHYVLDDESRAGLDAFYRLAHEEGLIERPRPLSFWPDG
jgi:chorismate dehydratase